MLFIYNGKKKKITRLYVCILSISHEIYVFFNVFEALMTTISNFDAN